VACESFTPEVRVIERPLEKFSQSPFALGGEAFRRPTETAHRDEKAFGLIGALLRDQTLDRYSRSPSQKLKRIENIHQTNSALFGTVLPDGE